MADASDDRGPSAPVSDEDKARLGAIVRRVHNPSDLAARLVELGWAS